MSIYKGFISIVLVILMVFAYIPEIEASSSVDTVLVIDASGSMQGTPWEEAKKSAKSFVDQVIGSNSRVAVVLFDAYVYNSALSNNSVDAYNFIDSYRPNGSTNLIGGLRAAQTILMNSSASVKNIVVLSDGLPNAGENSNFGIYNNNESWAYAYANACINWKAEVPGVNIYTYGFFHNSAENDRIFGARFLRDLATKEYFETLEVEKLEEDFQRVTDELTGNSGLYKTGYTGYDINYALLSPQVLQFTNAGSGNYYLKLRLTNVSNNAIGKFILHYGDDVNSKFEYFGIDANSYIDTEFNVYLRFGSGNQIVVPLYYIVDGVSYKGPKFVFTLVSGGAQIELLSARGTSIAVYQEGVRPRDYFEHTPEKRNSGFLQYYTKKSENKSPEVPKMNYNQNSDAKLYEMVYETEYTGPTVAVFKEVYRARTVKELWTLFDDSLNALVKIDNYTPVTYEYYYRLFNSMRNRYAVIELADINPFVKIDQYIALSEKYIENYVEFTNEFDIKFKEKARENRVVFNRPFIKEIYVDISEGVGGLCITKSSIENLPDDYYITFKSKYGGISIKVATLKSIGLDKIFVDITASDDHTVVQWRSKPNGSIISKEFSYYVLIPYEKTDDDDLIKTSVFFEGKTIGGIYRAENQCYEVKTRNRGKFSIGKNSRSFNDISNLTEEMKKSVFFMANRGFINGKSVDTFNPLDGMTRAEFVTVLTRLLLLSSQGHNANFKDVPAGKWFTEPVNASAFHKIVNGMPDGTFKPTSPITREQAVAIIGRELKNRMKFSLSDQEILNTLSEINSLDCGQWAKPDVAIARFYRIMDLTKDGNFRGKEGITRAEVAHLLARLYERIIRE